MENWTVKSLPPVHKTIPHPRIAVVEFSLQYAPPEPPVNVAASARLEIPGLVCGIFESIARDAGRVICPREEVQAALIERGVKGVRFEDIRMSASPAAEASRWVPVDGLLVLDDADPGLEAAVLKVVADTEADFALQFRLKVTLRNGRVVILPGSTLRLFSVHGPGLMESTRSFVSEAVLPTGTSADSSAFAEAVLQAVRPFLRTAVLTTGRDN
jgi:hypothetical protein